MGIPKSAPAPNSVGDLMRDKIVDDLQQKLSIPAPHLTVNQECKLAEFEQYAHLGAVRELSKDPSGADVEKTHLGFGDLRRPPAWYIEWSTRDSNPRF